MKRNLELLYLYFFAFLILLFPHTVESYGKDLGLPAPLSTTDGTPSGIVAGCVSAVDGVYFESEIDMVVPGPLPIVCSRTYNSRSNLWDLYPGSFLHKISDTYHQKSGITFKKYLEVSDHDGSHYLLT